MAENFSFYLICFLFLSIFLMEVLRVGSLNINGMRDGRKNEVLSEIIDLKDLSVTFLQELIVLVVMKLTGVYGGKESIFSVMGLI